MASGSEKTEFPIAIPVDTNAAEAATSVEKLREEISDSTDAIRAMSGTLRQLRGTTDEVKAAKIALTAKINATKDSVSKNSLALVKQGTTYDAAAMKAKKYAEAAKKLKSDEMVKAKERASAMSAAIGKAGGPVASLRDRLESLRSVAGGTGGAMGLATLAIAGTIAAVVAMAAAVASAGVSLAKFIIQSANTARSLGLVREAWAGSAQNAANMGSQIDALADKVPTSTAALNELFNGLMKTKMGGQATVDAFNAVGQASAALGDEAGNKLKDFITRGRMVGRLRIDPREMLEGFGALEFNDIAESLAKSTHIGIKQAKAALFEGRVKLGDGAKAIREAVDKRFGELNMRKMLDINVLSEKLHQKWANLTSGVKLEPLLVPLGKLMKLFDESTVTGATLKRMVTAFGTGMVGALEKGIPLAKMFFQGMIIGSLRAYVSYLKLKKAFVETFGDTKLFKGVDWLNVALKTGEIAAGALALSIGTVAAGCVAITAAASGTYEIMKKLVDVAEKVAKSMKSATGSQIAQGFVEGIVPGSGTAIKAVKGLAAKVKGAFAGDLKIQSPSKVFEGYGRHTVEGYAQGIEKEAPRAGGAITGMVGAPKAAGGASGGGGPRALTVNIYANGGGNAAKELSDPSFLAKLTKTIEDACVGAAIPVQG